MPTCLAYGCANTTDRVSIKKGFFMIPRPLKENKKNQSLKWFHNMGTGMDIKKFSFGRNKCLCEDHFHPDCFKCDLKAELMGTNPRKELLPGAIPTIFKHRNFDQINMDGTKIINRTSSLKRTQALSQVYLSLLIFLNSKNTRAKMHWIL